MFVYICRKHLRRVIDGEFPGRQLIYRLSGNADRQVLHVNKAAVQQAGPIATGGVNGTVAHQVGQVGAPSAGGGGGNEGATRYFLIRSVNDTNVRISQEKGVWSSFNPRCGRALDGAFRSSP
jgi:hypothetical protein